MNVGGFVRALDIKVKSCKMSELFSRLLKLGQSVFRIFAFVLEAVNRVFKYRKVIIRCNITAAVTFKRYTKISQ